MSKKPVLILHDDDRDGWGGRYAAYKKYADTYAEYKVIGHSAEQNGPRHGLIPEEPHEIYLIDYSWPLETLFEIAQTHDLTVIDHHESFADEVAAHGVVMDDHGEKFEFDWGDGTPELINHRPYSEQHDAGFWVFYNNSHAACVLAWQYFHRSETPKLLKHIEDRDLWNWEMKHTDEVLLAMDLEGYDPESIDVFARQTDRLVPKGAALAQYRDQKVEEMAENAVLRTTVLDGQELTLAFCNAPTLHSKVGHRVLEDHPKADVAVVFSADDICFGGTVRYSLRSRDDGPHVGKIATSYGGGGHANAAGLRADLRTVTVEDGLNDWVSEVFEPGSSQTFIQDYPTGTETITAL